MPLSGDWKNPSHKGGERFALLILSMYAEAGEPCGIKELIAETGMSLRQILRIVEDLKASGAINVSGGKGRAPYIITLASANDDKMASQETASDDKKSQDIMSSEAVTPPRSDDKMASLADAMTLCQDKPACSDDILSGTPVAPYSDIRTSTDNSQVSPSAQLGAVPKSKVVQHPSAKTETDHQRMMRELASRLGGIPDGGKQGKWAKWLLDHGHTVSECVECLDEMLAELKDPVHWREGKVDWAVVSSNIAAWKLRREGLETHGKPDGRTQNGAGGNPQAAGQPSRRERAAAELRRQAATTMFTGTPTRQTG